MVMCRSNPALEPRDMAGAARGGGELSACRAPQQPQAPPEHFRVTRPPCAGAEAPSAPAPSRSDSGAAHARAPAASQHVTRVAKRQAEFGQRRRRLWLWGLASASRSRKPETRRTGLRECARKQRETGKKYHRGSHQQWIKVLPATRENKLVLKLQTKYFHVPSSVRIILKQVPQKTCLRYS